MNKGFVGTIHEACIDFDWEQDPNNAGNVICSKCGYSMVIGDIG